jgi:hypothetical protein
MSSARAATAVPSSEFQVPSSGTWNVVKVPGFGEACTETALALAAETATTIDFCAKNAGARIRGLQRRHLRKHEAEMRQK